MAMIIDTTLQFKQGNERDLPELSVGEPAVTTDTKKFYMGFEGVNKEVAFKENIESYNIENNDKIEAMNTKVDELFTSVANGKQLIASAISDKGVPTLATDTFQKMSENIRHIDTNGNEIKNFADKQITYSNGYSDKYVCFAVCVNAEKLNIGDNIRLEYTFSNGVNVCDISGNNMGICNVGDSLLPYYDYTNTNSKMGDVIGYYSYETIWNNDKKCESSVGFVVDKIAQEKYIKMFILTGVEAFPCSFVIEKVVVKVNDEEVTIENIGSFRTQEVIEISDYIREDIVRVTGVTIKNSQSLNVGESDVLSPVIIPVTAVNKNVTYKSSDESVIAVSENGNVLALKEGTATVTITTVDGGHQTTCKYTVIKAIEEISVTSISIKSNSTLKVGFGEKLDIVIEPLTASSQQIIWSSSDEDILMVDEVGNVLALAEGNAVIIATTLDGKLTTTCYYTVTALDEEIPDNALSNLNGDIIYTKDGSIITVTINESGGETDTGGTDTGGNTDIPSGAILIESLGATGVVNPLAVGQIVTIGTKILPTEATEREVEWYTESPNSIEILSSGNDSCTFKTLALGYGSVSIKAVKGTATKTFYFTISLDEGVIAITSLGASGVTNPLPIGETMTLTPKITPTDATDKKVTWTLIQQDNIAEIVESTTEQCVIKGLKEGYYQLLINAVVGGASKVIYLSVTE